MFDDSKIHISAGYLHFLKKPKINKINHYIYKFKHILSKKSPFKRKYFELGLKTIFYACRKKGSFSKIPSSITGGYCRKTPQIAELIWDVHTDV